MDSLDDEEVVLLGVSVLLVGAGLQEREKRKKKILFVEVVEVDQAFVRQQY